MIVYVLFAAYHLPFTLTPDHLLLDDSQPAAGSGGATLILASILMGGFYGLNIPALGIAIGTPPPPLPRRTQVVVLLLFAGCWLLAAAGCWLLARLNRLIPLYRSLSPSYYCS